MYHTVESRDAEGEERFITYQKSSGRWIPRRLPLLQHKTLLLLGPHFLISQLKMKAEAGENNKGLGMVCQLLQAEKSVTAHKLYNYVFKDIKYILQSPQ